MEIATPGGGVPTILVDVAVTEHPVVVEQSKSQLEPLTQTVEHTCAVSVLHSSSSLSPSEPLSPPLPPLPPPPEISISGGQSRHGPLQCGAHDLPLPLLPLLTEGVGLPEDQVVEVVPLLIWVSLEVWDQGYGGGVRVVVVLVGVGPDPNGGSTYTMWGKVMLLVNSTTSGAVWLALIDIPHTGTSEIIASTWISWSCH